MKLVDLEGENQAVRAFLSQYQCCANLSIGSMKHHLKLSGYAYWPDWVEKEHGETHLSKSAAQLWIRHLFGLEKALAEDTDEHLDYLDIPAFLRRQES